FTLNMVSCNANGCVFNFNPTGGGNFTLGTGTTDASINNSVINYSGTGGPMLFFGGTVLNNVVINLTGSGSIALEGEVSNCTINVTGSGFAVSITSNAVVENCTFNLGVNTNVTINGNS